MVQNKIASSDIFTAFYFCIKQIEIIIVNETFNYSFFSIK
ncbi:hypothetical protein CSCA_3923 [Clostridium scatologenes]|uniref:Uncharacterized protein n=1 Tax=Clostridium scatologenes TaxID=1548 RepID=A0A0E3JQM1_CLOSL|nr:hypothetical protein CSCA_3923 [Clostridium scatologenes]